MSFENGNEFLKAIRNIINDVVLTSYHPLKSARLTAFVILTMLDGSGEFDGPEYKLYVRKEDGALESVNFFHHDL
ncbi:unnamed protein product [marine sediment metagenome]|uniref:Uncharacterized protein n=1 Tax=marine sediment metagenome TaxID=412755 RepID=X1GWY3_9ZZZZ